MTRKYMKKHNNKNFVFQSLIESKQRFVAYNNIKIVTVN